MNQSKEEKPTLQQNVTNDDLLQCNCGHNLFHTTYRVAAKKNPLIGKPPVAFPIPHGFVCVSCGAELNVPQKLEEREKG